MEAQALFRVTEEWKSAFPGAQAGVLVLRGAANPAHHPGLEREKAKLEQHLRAQFAGQDRRALLEHPVLKVYGDYYRRFKKTYHVQLQLESIAFKGKSIPSAAALVEVMFMAEMKNLLLTAGHDLDAVLPPLTLDVTRGTERYMPMRGEEQAVKPGDMMISDRLGIVSNIIYGPDLRTRITAETRGAAFTVYAPAGIDAAALRGHLQDMQDYVSIFAPQARTEMLQVFGSG
jgi:DNA/RNA-binding domain of Phe-tRNA-synthetase-like protein